jgi:hypothetical protein
MKGPPFSRIWLASAEFHGICVALFPAYRLLIMFYRAASYRVNVCDFFIDGQSMVMENLNSRVVISKGPVADYMTWNVVIRISDMSLFTNPFSLEYSHFRQNCALIIKETGECAEQSISSHKHGHLNEML